MAMLAEQYEFVIGGDPDRDTVDLAVVETATGGARAHLADRAEGAGYTRMLAWARPMPRAGECGHSRAPEASPPAWRCFSQTRGKTSSKLVG